MGTEALVLLSKKWPSDNIGTEKNFWTREAVPMFRFAISVWPIIILNSFGASVAQRRPFYIIAHMVNSVDEIEYFLNQGANALEADVGFSANGTALNTYHGVPCDCFRRCTQSSDLIAYLERMRELTARRGRAVSLLMLDLKSSGLSRPAAGLAGVDLFNKLVNHLWRGVNQARRINVLLSIPRTEDKSLFESVVGELRDGENAEFRHLIGFDVGMNSPLRDIATMYESIGITVNIWQGDGLTNCFSGIRVLKRLRDTIAIRDLRSGYVNKVYYWTIDLPLAMRNVLELGLDAILTNRPDRLFPLINTEFSQYYRLATPRDSPWTKMPAESPSENVGNSLKLSLEWKSGRAGSES